MRKYGKYVINYDWYVVFTEDNKTYNRRVYTDRKGLYIRFQNEKRYLKECECYHAPNFK